MPTTTKSQSNKVKAAHPLILENIMAGKRKEYENSRPIKASELERVSHAGKDSVDFRKALACEDRLSVIAEFKRKSPSAGEFAASHSEAAEQARKYINAEADCLSILTDNKHFGGSFQDLSNVVEFLQNHRRNIPCLCKEFMVHPAQVLQAAEAGAHCILIIVRALEDDEIQTLHEAASIAHLDMLFEIHDQKDLERALTFEPKIIGVNNRDLQRFKTSLSISEALIPEIPDPIVCVSASGISTIEDARRVRSLGADAILVGEVLMQAQETEIEELIQSFHQA